jgi:hypothetical protein
VVGKSDSKARTRQTATINESLYIVLPETKVPARRIGVTAAALPSAPSILSLSRLQQERRREKFEKAKLRTAYAATQLTAPGFWS